jgi:transcriptional regulator with XRE-family HTH domain
MQLRQELPNMPRKKTSSTNGFAERLKTLRQQHHLSQTELGELVDLHYTHIGRYERGTSRPAADTLNRLATALGVSGDYLMQGTIEQAACARFDDRELLTQFEEVQKLEDEDKRVVKIFLDAFLAKKKIAKLVAS